MESALFTALFHCLLLLVVCTVAVVRLFASF